MYSVSCFVNDLYCGDDKEMVESVSAFNKWYQQEGMNHSEVEQLRWLVRNPLVSAKMKDLLIFRYRRALETEKEDLLRFGRTPERFYDLTGTHARAALGKNRGKFLAGLIVAIVTMALYVVVFLFTTLCSDEALIVLELVMSVLFGTAVLSVLMAVEAWRHTDGERLDNEASKSLCANIGGAVEMRIFEIAMDVEELNELERYFNNTLLGK